MCGAALAMSFSQVSLSRRSSTANMAGSSDSALNPGNWRLMGQNCGDGHSSSRGMSANDTGRQCRQSAAHKRVARLEECMADVVYREDWRNPAPEKHYSERHSGSLLRISGISPVKLRCAHGHAPLAPLRTLSARVLMCYITLYGLRHARRAFAHLRSPIGVSSCTSRATF